MMNHNPYPIQPRLNEVALPDPFLRPDGRRISAPDEWPAQADFWRNQITDMIFGGLPPAPESVSVETLCHAGVRQWAPDLKNWTYRLRCDGGEYPFTFCVRVLSPASEEPVPAIIAGDGCWKYLTDDILQMFLQQGIAVVVFNRTEMAEDLGYEDVPDKTKRSGGLYDVYPGMTFGAISAWAWGVHRCVDLLVQLPFIDSTRIGVSGHSRGGKTALLAGLTDERISLINDNASGIGGGAVSRYVGDAGETLDIIKTRFPSWFGPALQDVSDVDQDLPFDQHCLLASLAPRHVLLTYALDDRWSNPEGMVQNVWAAREVFRFLDAEENLAFHLREGVHMHAPQDWKILLDFVSTTWRGEPPKITWNQHPYDHLRLDASWLR